MGCHVTICCRVGLHSPFLFCRNVFLRQFELDSHVFLFQVFVVVISLSFLSVSCFLREMTILRKKHLKG